MNKKNKFVFAVLLLMVISFSGFVLGNQNLRAMPEHEYAKITRDRVTAAMATTGSKKEIKLAEGSLTALGWFVLYGNDNNSADLAKMMNDIVFKAYNGTDKMNVIYMDHTSTAYGEMLNLNRFEKRKPDNPSVEYSKIVQSRIEKAFAPSAGYAEFKLAEGSLAALGWMTLFGNDANSKNLATQLMNKSFNEWRGANEVYMLQSSEAYSEMINLGRFKLNASIVSNSTPTASSDPVEDQYWDAVKNSARAQDFQSYLTAYPNGKYAAIARTKLSPQTVTPTTSGRLTDVQFLNNWAAQTKVGLPEELGEFQLAKAWSRCPNGCEESDSSPYLLLMFNALGYQQTAPMTQLEPKLKPLLLGEYCKSEAVQRKISLGVFFQDRGQNVGYNNFWVEPKDCSANTSQTINLALGKTATQSGDIGEPFKANEGLASKAVDGNTDGDWFKGSVTSTACGIDATNECRGSANPYWQVDLGAVYQVDKIEIWNRTDCCKERLSNYRIWVKGATGDWQEFSPGLKTFSQSEQYPLTFNGNKQARYVMIQLVNPSAILSLAEVKVFGTN